ncbi:hypothetical protein [Paenibacillus caui]|uniref:hypothetical protein n=1 Tax=Paenibacillus caui TaxID=2873927 RepID=UPI001CA7FB06|nr:hypothetical protein [Paenibacillus caui]
MSAFEEFDKERREIDELLFKGYHVAAIREDLDGAKVTFVMGKPDKGQVTLLLLTADARKYIVTRYMEGKRANA